MDKNIKTVVNNILESGNVRKSITEFHVPVDGDYYDIDPFKNDGKKHVKDMLIGKTGYFTANLVDSPDNPASDMLKLTDMNDNYTLMYKSEVKDLIKLLEKGLKYLD